MAIIIITKPTPAAGVLRAYQPMLFKIGVTTIGTAPPSIVAVVLINGQSFGQAAVITPRDLETSPTLQYIFYYDPKLIIQSYFDNQESWLAINDQTSTVKPLDNQANTGFAKKCVFTVTFLAYEQIPPSNLPAPTDSVTSTPLTSFNAAALPTSIENLTPFFQYPQEWANNYPKINSTTKRATAYTADGGNNFFLTHHSQGNKDESLEITLYDFAGNLSATHFIKLEQSNGSAERFRTLGVGVANINNASAGAWRGSPPAQPLITDAFFYYEVRVVWTDAMLNVTNVITNPFRFYITSPCEQVQVFYCNEFGFIDVILFNYKDCEISYSNENNVYNSPILDFPMSNKRGITTATATGQTRYSLRGLFAPNRAQQLKELWISPNIAVLLPNQTQYIAVVKAENSEMIEKRANNGHLEFEINLIQSTVNNSQRG